jgi:phage-related protein
MIESIAVATDAFIYYDVLLHTIGRESNMTPKIRRGAHVKILGNAKGTAWETGCVADINEDGALINYGSWQIPI